MPAISGPRVVDFGRPLMLGSSNSEELVPVRGCWYRLCVARVWWSLRCRWTWVQFVGLKNRCLCAGAGAAISGPRVVDFGRPLMLGSSNSEELVPVRGCWYRLCVARVWWSLRCRWTWVQFVGLKNRCLCAGAGASHQRPARGGLWAAAGAGDGLAVQSAGGGVHSPEPARAQRQRALRHRARLLELVPPCAARCLATRRV